MSSTFGRPQWATRNISLADVNRDKLPDIVVANRSSKGPSPNYICPNIGEGRFQTDCEPFSDESATTITPFDMDGDGKMDIVANHTGRQGTRRGVSLYFGLGAGEFSEGVVIGDSSSKPYALATADLYLDGAPDIVVGHVEAPTAVFLNQRNGEQFHAIDINDLAKPGWFRSTTKFSDVGASHKRSATAGQNERFNVIIDCSRFNRRHQSFADLLRDRINGWIVDPDNANRTTFFYRTLHAIAS